MKIPTLFDLHWSLSVQLQETSSRQIYRQTMQPSISPPYRAVNLSTSLSSHITDRLQPVCFPSIVAPEVFQFILFIIIAYQGNLIKATGNKWRLHFPDAGDAVFSDGFTVERAAPFL